MGLRMQVGLVIPSTVPAEVIDKWAGLDSKAMVGVKMLEPVSMPVLPLPDPQLPEVVLVQPMVHPEDVKPVQSIAHEALDQPGVATDAAAQDLTDAEDAKFVQAVAEPVATMTTTEICKRLGFIVNVAFLKTLGLKPVMENKGAAHWAKSDWSTLCQAIIGYCNSIEFKKDA